MSGRLGWQGDADAPTHPAPEHTPEMLSSAPPRPAAGLFITMRAAPLGDVTTDEHYVRGQVARAARQDAAERGLQPVGPVTVRFDTHPANLQALRPGWCLAVAYCRAVPLAEAAQEKQQGRLSDALDAGTPVHSGIPTRG